MTAPDSDAIPSDSDADLVRAEQTAFTDNEINLLASNNVYRSPDSGEWFHREEYPDGRLMITPVNPNAELRRARGKTPPFTLVPFIRCARFEDDEFPEWWYSPARDKADDVRSTPDEVRSTPMGADETRSDVKEGVVLRLHTPRTPASREEGAGRPILSDRIRSERISVDRRSSRAISVDRLQSGRAQRSR